MRIVVVLIAINIYVRRFRKFRISKFPKFSKDSKNPNSIYKDEHKQHFAHPTLVSDRERNREMAVKSRYSFVL